jgi:hypothetical protein
MQAPHGRRVDQHHRCSALEKHRWWWCWLCNCARLHCLHGSDAGVLVSASVTLRQALLCLPIRHCGGHACRVEAPAAAPTGARHSTSAPAAGQATPLLQLHLRAHRLWRPLPLGGSIGQGTSRSIKHRYIGDIAIAHGVNVDACLCMGLLGISCARLAARMPLLASVSSS